MPVTPHVERHFTSGETVRDIVIPAAETKEVADVLASSSRVLATARDGCRQSVSAVQARELLKAMVDQKPKERLP